MNDAETWSEFPFLKNDIFWLKDAPKFQDYFKTYNRQRISGIEGLCIMLNPLAYPCRYSEFIQRFGRPVPDYCIIFYDIMNQDNYLLSNFNLPFLLRPHLTAYCQAINN